MFKTLLVLFRVTNIISFVLILLAFALCFVYKIRYSSLKELHISLPKFDEVTLLSKYCSRCGLLFIVMDWLLCSAEAVQTSSISVFSEDSLHFGVMWTIVMLATVLCEIALKFIHVESDEKFTVASVIPTSLTYALIYFCFSFLTA